ncbi:hypothetical protein Sste5346_000044 [Sporothrix stenoceras]|uniref:C6 zinc finger domain containing protein n=1 Tax=Sporothrix stenoceras TaxID=5173 RepID=A0ABR3ZV18_9PEZI
MPCTPANDLLDLLDVGQDSRSPRSPSTGPEPARRPGPGPGSDPGSGRADTTDSARQVDEVRYLSHFLHRFAAILDPSLFQTATEVASIPELRKGLIALSACDLAIQTNAVERSPSILVSASSASSASSSLSSSSSASSASPLRSPLSSATARPTRPPSSSSSSSSGSSHLAVAIEYYDDALRALAWQCQSRAIQQDLAVQQDGARERHGTQGTHATHVLAAVLVCALYELRAGSHRGIFSHLAGADALVLQNHASIAQSAHGRALLSLWSRTRAYRRAHLLPFRPLDQEVEMAAHTPGAWSYQLSLTYCCDAGDEIHILLSQASSLRNRLVINTCIPPGQDPSRWYADHFGCPLSLPMFLLGDSKGGSGGDSPHKSLNTVNTMPQIGVQALCRLLADERQSLDQWHNRLPASRLPYERLTTATIISAPTPTATGPTTSSTTTATTTTTTTNSTGVSTTTTKTTTTENTTTVNTTAKATPAAYAWAGAEPLLRPLYFQDLASAKQYLCYALAQLLCCEHVVQEALCTHHTDTGMPSEHTSVHPWACLIVRILLGLDTSALTSLWEKNFDIDLVMVLNVLCTCCPFTSFIHYVRDILLPRAGLGLGFSLSLNTNANFELMVQRRAIQMILDELAKDRVPMLIVPMFSMGREALDTHCQDVRQPMKAAVHGRTRHGPYSACMDMPAAP